MSDWTAIEAGIRRHLDRVGAAFGGTLEERAEICAQVEEHIRAALAARGDAVTVEDLQAVLAEMDPPASYGDGGVRVPAEGPPGRSWVPGCLVAVAAVFLVLVLSNCVYLWLGRAAGREAEGGATADPAVVVSTMPVQGDRAVDPGLQEIRVTFDRPMLTDRMWSWCLESEETWPDLDVDRIRYLDDRTCAAPVRLEPGRTYVIWINTEQHDSFRDTLHRPAVPYRLEFATAGGEAGGS